MPERLGPNVEAHDVNKEFNVLPGYRSRLSIIELIHRLQPTFIKNWLCSLANAML